MPVKGVGDGVHDRFNETVVTRTTPVTLVARVFLQRSLDILVGSHRHGVNVIRSSLSRRVPPSFFHPLAHERVVVVVIAEPHVPSLSGTCSYVLYITGLYIRYRPIGISHEISYH